MKNINTINNYRTFSRNMQLKFDEFYAEKIIPENDSVRLLDKIVEEMERPMQRVHKRTGHNFFVKLLSDLVAYSFIPKKPAFNMSNSLAII